MKNSIIKENGWFFCLYIHIENNYKNIYTSKILNIKKIYPNWSFQSLINVINFIQIRK